MTDTATTGEATLELGADPSKLADAEITIDGDKTEIKEVSAATVAAEPAKKNEPAEPTIDDLRAQLKVYDDRAKAAERAASDANAQLSAVSRNAVDANLSMIVSSIETAKGVSATARGELQRAMEGGDFAKAAEAQEALADARANLLRLQERKAEVENGRGQPPQRQQAPVSEIEQIASRLSPPSAAWIRAHPEVANDFGKAEAAHNYITRIKGVVVDTPEYFRRIEEELGMRQPEPTRTEARPTQRVTMQAPVTQSAPSLQTGHSERQTVTLSAAERDVAREMNMTDREYAIEKMAAIREGKMGQVRH